MGSSSKRARRRQKAHESLEREASHSDPQRSPVKRPKPESDQEEEEDHEVLFPPRKQVTVPSSPRTVLEVPDCDVAIMVRTLNGAIAAVSQDTARIQRAYHQLCTDNIARDKALADLTAMVRKLVTCRLAAQDRTLPSPSNRRVGTYIRITGHNATETIVRETLRRQDLTHTGLHALHSAPLSSSHITSTSSS